MKKRKESDSGMEFGADTPRLSPIDVQQQQFRRSFRGYDEQEVDDFLDRVTEELSLLLEERRTALERGGAAPAAAAADAGQIEDATRSAEDIKRSAREQAEALVRDAQARATAILRDAEARAGSPVGASSGAPSGSGPALSSFVSREREFLQRLAQLVQGHAEGVRDMVQAARRGSQATASPAPSPPAPDAPPAPSAPQVTSAPSEAPEPARPEADLPEPEPAQPEPEPPSGSGPPETSVDLPAEGGPVMEAASAAPVSSRAPVVLLPEAGRPDEAPAPRGESTSRAELQEDATPGGEPELQPEGEVGPSTGAGEPSGGLSVPEPPRLPDLPAPPQFAEQALRTSVPKPTSHEATETASGAHALSGQASSERPVPVPGRASEAAAEDEDRDAPREADRKTTLRELFWGED